MVGIGIDIGSTAAKAAVVETDNAIAWTCVMPTGYSSVDAAERLRGELAAAGYDVTGDDVRVVATGYGRVAVPYANKVVTEITCHGAGAVRLFGEQGTVIDVGGQDTKVIQLKGGRVAKFAMNDKCAAGWGAFWRSWPTAWAFPSSRWPTWRVPASPPRSAACARCLPKARSSA